MMAVHPSGFYAWCAEPESERAREDWRLLAHIKQSGWKAEGCTGYRKVSDDLRDLGEQCGINRVTESCAPLDCVSRRTMASVALNEVVPLPWSPRTIYSDSST